MKTRTYLLGLNHDDTDLVFKISLPLCSNDESGLEYQILLLDTKINM